METIEPCKKITAKELLYIVGSASHQKFMQNGHKGNILIHDYEYLFKRMKEEIDEFNKAFRIFQSNQTDRNKNELLMEAGDVINFISAIVAKADNYTELLRE